MKKGLLLSIVASTVIFAGGDIAPVEPAAAAPAADCSDFYGSVGAYYQSQAWDTGDIFSTDTFSGTAGVKAPVTNFSVTAVVGVEKTLFSGIGFGAEVAGWSSLGWPDVTNNVTNRAGTSTEGGELSQLYLTASFGNTAIKIGRFALPVALSPYAWSDRTGGVLDVTYEGALVANTDLADTTIYGVYAKNMTNGTTRTATGADSIGLFALGFVNKSIANTTVTAVGYYVPDATIIAGTDQAVYSGFLTVASKFGDYGVKAMVAAVGGDSANSIYSFNALGDTTFGVEGEISGNFGMFDAKLAASYVNDGSFKLNPVTGYSALATDKAEAFEVYVGAGGVSHAVTGVTLDLGVKAGPGKLYGSLGYWDFDTTAAADRDNTVGARVGYKFKVAGISTKVEYRYRDRTANNGTETERHRVRIEAQYKF